MLSSSRADREHSRGGIVVMRIAGAWTWLLCLALWLHGCASASAPKKACISFDVVDTLNLYDGRPHPLTLYIYPLSTTEGFEQTGADDLLAGARPAGVLAPPTPLTVEPGEQKIAFQDLFPVDTHHIGVVADYYRAPDDAEGSRRAVVPARCSILKPKLELSSSDLIVD